MIKILIPQNKGKNKTEVRGFWLDNNKIYYDYLTIQNYQDNNEQGLFTHLKGLKTFYRQECIFFIEAGQGKIYYSRDKVITLCNRIYSEVSRENLKREIKEALRDYKGITIYQEGKRYYKEIYY